MAILLASSVSTYAPNISASAGTITDGNYIPIVQERIQLITNNFFVSEDLNLQAQVTFNATARTIIISSDSTHWEDYGFKSGDDVFIYRSYRNDGIVTIDSLSDSTLTVTSTCSVVDESFSNSDGALIYFAVVSWPLPVIQAAAKMIEYDIDYRGKVSYNLKSQTLGPRSETYNNVEIDEEWGYPKRILSLLDKYKVVRFN